MSRRAVSPVRRNASPVRRNASPVRRAASPIRFTRRAAVPARQPDELVERASNAILSQVDHLADNYLQRQSPYNLNRIENVHGYGGLLGHFVKDVTADTYDLSDDQIRRVVNAISPHLVDRVREKFLILVYAIAREDVAYQQYITESQARNRDYLRKLELHDQRN